MDLYEQNNYTIDDIQALVFLSISLILSRSSFDTSIIWERKYLVFNKTP